VFVTIESLFNITGVFTDFTVDCVSVDNRGKKAAADVVFSHY